MMTSLIITLRPRQLRLGHRCRHHEKISCFHEIECYSFSVIRRLTAAFLLLCMTFLVPASAASIRVCFDEHRVVAPGWTKSSSLDSGETKCCKSCEGGEKAPCCSDMPQLPDSTTPAAPVALPTLYFVQDFLACLIPLCLVTEVSPRVGDFPPDPQSDPRASFRARLGVWII